MHSEETRAAFAAVMRLRDDDLPLDQAALLLARGIAYPDLELAQSLAYLDALAAGFREREQPDRNAAPRKVVEALGRYLGGELGFRGPERARDQDYDDPRNSFLNEVLTRRIGIPISLSVVYLEVARRVGCPLVGVGMPFHFLIKYSTGGPLTEDLYSDPMRGGAIAGVAQLRERFEAQAQGRLPFAEHYLGASTKRQILTRMLRNLHGVYHRRNQPWQVLRVLDYLLLIAPWDLECRRDRGLLALQLGATTQALEDLQVYERFTDGDPNLPIIRGYIEALRRRFSLGG